jgi:penicillin amidase
MRSRIVVFAVGIAALTAIAFPARAGSPIRIVRDRFGVPHVFGATGQDVAYGAGYALAQDRLWQMHIFSLVSKGRLSHLLGPLIVASDKTVRFWTYTAAERARRFATYPADIKAWWLAWVDGINAWITEVRADPINKLPFEFVEFAEPLEDWTIDDSVAMSDYLIFTFGSGGGAEVRNLADLQSYVAKFGTTEGPRVWDDMIWLNDPDAPLSIPEDYAWRSTPSMARPVADAKTLEPDARISLPEDQRIASSAAGPVTLRSQKDLLRIPVSPSVLADVDALQQGEDALAKIFFKFGSNAQIVAPSRTVSGNTALQAGPQVGHFVPEALSDFGMHAADGSIDATGMTFAGVGPAVLIGRGKGYNWTTTTGASDITDTFVEQLNPANQRQYLFDPDAGGGDPARWENMECRTESYELKGLPFDSQEICRTRHGPVLSFDAANNVAYAARYSWFNREGGTVEGFFRYNQVHSLEDFATYANLLASNHNMFYADDQGNIAYWHPGNFPKRPVGDMRLPFVGNGTQEWQGLLKADEVPHAINLPRGWLANWNNKPAIDWDRENGWGAVHGVQTFLDNLDAAKAPLSDPWGGIINADKEVSWEDLNANIRYAAFRDFNADFMQPFLPASGASATETKALDVLRDYDGFIYDANGDKKVDSAGYTILGRFTTELRIAIFNDDLNGVPNRSSTSSVVHVMNPAARLAPEHGWLGAETRAAVAARAFTATIAALAAQYGSAEPSTWLSDQPEQHYTRLNADLLTDVVRETARSNIRARTGVNVALLEPGAVNVPPGNLPNQTRMNRGTYNHIVLYLDPPTDSGVLGASRTVAGSVISPGQSGFINLLGQEARHARDQFDLYVQWRYKPMPMTLGEALAVAESDITITRL